MKLDGFGGLDIDNLCGFSLKCDSSNTDNNIFAPLCHIPSISNLFPKDLVSGSTLDAMLVMERPPDNPLSYRGHCTISLLLYDAFTARTKENVNVKHTFSHLLDHDIWLENQFIFCPQRNSVIYEHNDNLYEMDFNVDLFEIKELKQQQLQFVVIYILYLFQSNDLNHFENRRFDGSKNNAQCHGCLYMEYIPTVNSLFSVHCRFQESTEEVAFDHMDRHKARCGLYNFDNNRWTDLPPFEYECDPNANTFSCKTLFDGNDTVYLWGTDRKFSKLGLNQVQWEKTDITLPFLTFGTTWVAWMESGCIMRVVARSTTNPWGTTNEAETMQIHNLDLRMRRKEWTSYEVDISVLMESAGYTQFVW